MRSSIRLVLRTVRGAWSLATLALLVALLYRFAALLLPLGRIETLPAVVRTQAWLDAGITRVAGLAAISWPAVRAWYVPLVLGALSWMVREWVIGRLMTWEARLGRAAAPRAAAAPAPRDEPAPALEKTTGLPEATYVPALTTTHLAGAPVPTPVAPLQATTDDSEDPTLDAIRSGPAAVHVAHRAPERIGRYEIEAELGRGAMGVVYKAKDPQIGRAVAIKTILSANVTSESLDQYKKRFAIEARAAGQLAHGGIVAVHDLCEDAAGQPSMVMEYVDGDTLEKLVDSGRAPGADQSLEIMARVAEAVDYAHSHGVIHRDIKPANILVTKRGEVKLADFGVAKLDGVQLTSTGMVIGTPAFMSPEQFNGAAIDARSDIFSIGSVLYWLLAGRKPFAGDTITAIGYKVMFTDPEPLRDVRPDLPSHLDDIVGRCLAKDRTMRFATARELAAELRALRARPADDLDGTRPDMVEDQSEDPTLSHEPPAR